jgi:hypothetical protein
MNTKMPSDELALPSAVAAMFWMRMPCWEAPALVFASVFS